MAQYLVSGLDPYGNRVTKNIEATSADEAVRTMQEIGYAEITLHTDDVGARYINPADGELTPEEFVGLATGGPIAHTLWLIGKFYVGSWLSVAMAIGYLAVRYAVGPESMFLVKGSDFQSASAALDWISAFAILYPLGLALLTGFTGDSRIYDAFIDHLAWGRWSAAIALVPQVDEIETVPPEETAFGHAKALAGLGRLEEALQILAAFDSESVMPQWLYHSRLVDVYSAANRTDLAVAAMEHAAILAPDNPIVLLDVAMILVTKHSEPSRAEEYFERANQHAISDQAQPLAAYIAGLIAYRKQDYTSASVWIQDALRGCEKFRAASPAMGQVIDEIRGWHAITLARQGDLDAARKLFNRSLPRLKAVEANEIIDEYSQADRTFQIE